MLFMVYSLFHNTFEGGPHIQLCDIKQSAKYVGFCQWK